MGTMEGSQREFTTKLMKGFVGGITAGSMAGFTVGFMGGTRQEPWRDSRTDSQQGSWWDSWRDSQWDSWKDSQQGSRLLQPRSSGREQRVLQGHRAAGFCRGTEQRCSRSRLQSRPQRRRQPGAMDPAANGSPGSLRSPPSPLPSVATGASPPPSPHSGINGAAPAAIWSGGPAPLPPRDRGPRRGRVLRVPEVTNTPHGGAGVTGPLPRPAVSSGVPSEPPRGERPVRPLPLGFNRLVAYEHPHHVMNQRLRAAQQSCD